MKYKFGFYSKKLFSNLILTVKIMFLPEILNKIKKSRFGSVVSFVENCNFTIYGGSKALNCQKSYIITEICDFGKKYVKIGVLYP